MLYLHAFLVPLRVALPDAVMNDLGVPVLLGVHAAEDGAVQGAEAGELVHHVHLRVRLHVHLRIALDHLLLVHVSDLFLRAGLDLVGRLRYADSVPEVRLSIVEVRRNWRASVHLVEEELLGDRTELGIHLLGAICVLTLALAVRGPLDLLHTVPVHLEVRVDDRIPLRPRDELRCSVRREPLVVRLQHLLLPFLVINLRGSLLDLLGRRLHFLHQELALLAFLVAFEVRIRVSHGVVDILMVEGLAVFVLIVAREVGWRVFVGLHRKGLAEWRSHVVVRGLEATLLLVRLLSGAVEHHQVVYHAELAT